MLESIKAALSGVPEFILAVLLSWSGLITGGVVMAVVTAWERKSGKILPWKVFKAGIITFLLVSFYSAWYDQRQQVLTTQKVVSDLNAKLLNDRQALTSKDAQITGLGTQVGNLGSQISTHEAGIANRDKSLTNRDVQITNRDAQIGGLQARMLDFQKTIGELQVELGKAKQPEPQRITMLAIATPRPDPTIAPDVKNYLLLTNRSITPLRAIVFCDNAIVDASGSLLGASMMVAGQDRRAPNAYQITIESPPWSPASPLLITIHHEKDVGNCYFNLMN